MTLLYIEAKQESAVGKIVRITGRSKTFLQQISALTENKNGYTPTYLESPEEAEKYLSERQ